MGEKKKIKAASKTPDPNASLEKKNARRRKIGRCGEGRVEKS